MWVSDIMSQKEKVVYRVRVMYYAVLDFDSVKSVLGDVPMPIRVERVRIGKGRLRWLAASATAKIAGLGLVRDGERATVIGNAMSMQVWEWPYLPPRWAYEEAMDFLDHPLDVRPQTAQAKAGREQLLKVQHTAAAMFPDLRLWPDERDHQAGGDEVQFKRIFTKNVFGGLLAE